MKILIIEDDALKCAKITELVEEVNPAAVLSYARSYKSGLKAAVLKECDLILLDMTLPTFDITDEEEGGPPLAFGGREVLRQLRRHQVRVPVVVVTQFEQFESSGSTITLAELTSEMRAEFSDNFISTVYYNPTQSKWRDLLRQEIINIMRAGSDDA